MGCFFSLLVVGCQSDEDKLRELQGEYSTAALNTQVMEQRLKHENKKDSAILRDSLYSWMTRRDLAERDLNKFMGR